MLGDVLWACHSDHTKAGGGAGLWVIVGERMHFVQETDRTTGVLVTDVNDCSEAGGGRGEKVIEGQHSPVMG